MTLLRVYKKNGIPVRDENSYRYSDIFNDFFGEENSYADYSTPKVNVRENKEFYELEVALPGVSKEDVQIDVDKNLLNISEKEKEVSSEEITYNRREFDFSRFQRSFRLPETIATEKIKAKMENGILSLQLPKKEEAIDRGPKEIKIS